MVERLKIRRCAIYTRKSSEEGLDQAYNSLAAQRDAYAAYITSQKHEGWVATAKGYDDGGFSGGSLERPALQQLFEDLKRGEIDIIVVYKVDRLTRSLADFAKLTELLDQHQVSFVAVTQQFNTSTSMGRLTLNVLLSFAQFEREVAGERIRDKIGASKRRGMWMGGHPPLGYDAKDRTLVVNETEAENVRQIFRLYLDLGSVKRLCDELHQSGIRSKHRRREDGTVYGGMLLARGAVTYLLQNNIYLGKIFHKGELFDGQHEPIVPIELFEAVQHKLKVQGPGEAANKKLASPAILKGLVFDGDGNRLQPTHSTKHGRKYRYYVSASIIRDAKSGRGGLRVPAADLEQLVIRSLVNRLNDRHWLANLAEAHREAGGFEEITTNAAELTNKLRKLPTKNTGLLNTITERVEVEKKSVRITLALAQLHEQLGITASKREARPGDPDLLIEVPGHILRCGKEVRLVIGNEHAPENRADQRLIREIVQARKWFSELCLGQANGIADLARRSKINAAHVSRRITLAFLAPDITEMILFGSQPLTLTPERLARACPLPPSWEDQRAILLH